ncbi:MAG: tRNA (pseudouridine(54)-N(1))-methyltransferase TrmY [Candidatus Micrarchaeia archaeon]
MRTFVLYSRKGRTDPNFNNLIDAGRMDLVARCISNVLFLSKSLRNDRIICVLNGPPRGPISIEFNGYLKPILPDEQSIGNLIKTALKYRITNEWNEPFSGVKIAKKSFQDVIRELSSFPIYILHEKGKMITDVDVEDNPVFVLGDNFGIPKNDESYALRFSKEKISLGKKSYLASQCITAINWFCDLKGIF